jgi:hypothetical protein
MCILLHKRNSAKNIGAGVRVGVGKIDDGYYEACRSQWTRGLRRRSAAARLLRWWVRIPAEARMSVVSVVCCQVEVFATS